MPDIMLLVDVLKNIEEQLARIAYAKELEVAMRLYRMNSGATAPEAVKFAEERRKEFFCGEE